MARIRTIKPEFPQSETVGSLSREARLTFILLWTIADDAGRGRGSTRLLASLLYPYDEDATSLLDGWILELEKAECVRRYTIDGKQYFDIPSWLKHQKIDKPSASRIPPFAEASRTFAEPSTPDLGPSILDLGSRTLDQDHIRGFKEPLAPNGAGHSPPLRVPEQPDEMQEAVAAWNAMASKAGLAQVQRITPKRKAALRARLRDAGGIAGWHSALDKVAVSEFLCGDNDRGWKADFDFVTRLEKFTRIMEGGYPNGRDTKKQQSDEDRRERQEAILRATGLVD